MKTRRTSTSTGNDIIASIVLSLAVSPPWESRLGVQERLDRRRRASKLVGGKNLATGAGREGLKDLEDDQLLDESDTAVAHTDIDSTGV